MPLPLGAYPIIANGANLTLNISSNTNGNISGTLGSDSIQGFWDETSARIVFFRMPSNIVANTQVFSGVQLVNQNLVGTFEGFSGTGATAARTVYGWESTSHP